MSVSEKGSHVSHPLVSAPHDGIGRFLSRAGDPRGISERSVLATVLQLSRFELLLPQDWGPLVVWTVPPALLLGIAIGRFSEYEQKTG